MKMKMLFKETAELIKEAGHDESEVIWVGTIEKKTTWDNFRQLSAFIYEDDGFGSPYINGGLLVVGKDWWLERYAQDGSEWWEYKKLPLEPKDSTLSQKDLIEEYRITIKDGCAVYDLDKFSKKYSQGRTP